MISISTVISDIKGNVVINSSMDIRENIARLIRTKTLDGGVVINNSGFSYGDITIIIEYRISEDQSNILWYIFQEYTSILISTNRGLFLASIKSLKIDNGLMEMTIYIASKES